MSVVVVGLNHRSVPLNVLERMTIADQLLPKVLHDLSSRANVIEAVVLSTCMRIEVYAFVERFHAGFGEIRDFLAETGRLAPEDFSDHLYSFHDDAAVTHLFKVAAGLDSAVLGEGEILGQVREAWERARAEDVAGPVLDRLFRHAIEVGKRARADTGISRGTTSVSQAAVSMATQRLGDLGGRRILVLGAGEMGEGMAVALAGAAPSSEVLVANRTVSKAKALASRIGGTAVGLDAMADALTEVDVILTSTGSPTVLLEADDVAAVLPERAGRPLLVVDIAVPRDVDPAVAELDGVTLLDMDDLRAFAAAGFESRRQEVAKVETIIAAELVRYRGRAAAAEAAPLVSALRERGESLRMAEIERYRSRLVGLDARQREAVEALTRGIVNKLLHDPTVRLKDEAGTARGDQLAEALRTLFDL